MFEKGQIEPQVQLRGTIANPKTLILSYPLLRGWGSKIYAEGLFKHPLRTTQYYSLKIKIVFSNLSEAIPGRLRTSNSC